MSPLATAPPSVTGIVRASRTQGLTSAKVSLMLRCASWTWCGRRQNWMSSSSVATWGQMSMSSSFLKPWRLPIFVPTSTKSGEKLWQRWLSHPSAAPPFHIILNKVLPSTGANRLQTGMYGASGKPQGTVIRVHVGQVTMSICTKLQNKTHVIEALRRAEFKFAGCQKMPRSGDLKSLMRINLKTWWQKSGSSPMAGG